MPAPAPVFSLSPLGPNTPTADCPATRAACLYTSCPRALDDFARSLGCLRRSRTAMQGKPIYRLTPDQHAAALARGARPLTNREFLTLLA